MDYSSYFPPTPQALPFFSLPHAPFGDDGKLDVPDSADAAFFPYDSFRFPQLAQQPPTPFPPHTENSPVISTSIISAGPPDGSPTALLGGIGSSGSVDDGAGVDSLNNTNHNDSSENNSGRTRSPSEEKESLTPAQSRRKAQNRAAQRAFRERKERHVRELEAKLSALESSATSLATDNERLKLALQRATTENEILRATNSSTSRLSVGSSLDCSDSSSGAVRALGVGPMGLGSMPTGSEMTAGGAVAAAQALLARNGSISDQPGDQSSAASADGYPASECGELSSIEGPAALQNDSPLISTKSFASTTGGTSHQIVSGRGSEFLPAAATWDLIQAHPLVKQGVVDIADVCEALRGTARSDGQGPVFREESVWKAVEGVRRGGGDELI